MIKHNATKVSADTLNLALFGTKFSFGKVELIQKL